MRKQLGLVSLLALAACGGGGPQTAGGSVALGGVTPSGTAETLATPTTAHTYAGVGGSQSFSYLTDDRETRSNGVVPNAGQQAQIFGSNDSSVRSSTISISYDPSNAVFSLQVADPKSGAATTTRFQDPASRTNFGGAVEPQWGTTNLNDPNIHFLQAGDGDPLSPYLASGTGFVDHGNNATPPTGQAGSSYQSATFFYQVPDTTNRAGTKTKYVTFAGYLRNNLSWADVVNGGNSLKQATWRLERGAFAYGIQASNSAVPITGNGRYEGGMLATAVVNPTLDGAYGSTLPSYFQWIYGTSTLDIDFGSGSVKSHFAGQVYAPQADLASVSNITPPANLSTIAAGATFSADGHGTINLVNTGGFTGQIDSASFSATTNGAPTAVNVIGSSLNGAFYGPATSGNQKLGTDQVEVGGGFHVVGGTPDQRVDIVGAFAGARTGAAH